ncbi:MAG: PTS mannose transporter subunit IIA [Longicatena sp.]
MENTIMLITTHGQFGEEIVKSAEMIIGPMKNVKTFSLVPGRDPFEFGYEISNYINENKNCDFISLVDLYGGTPSNMMAAQLNKCDIEIVSGLNLGMLIETYSMMRNETIENLKKCALSTLNSSGYDIREKLEELQKRKEV